MSRALILTEKQARTLIRAAGKEKATLTVNIGGAVVHVIPHNSPQASGPIDQMKTPDDFQTLSEWKAWRDRNLDREAPRDS